MRRGGVLQAGLLRGAGGSEAAPSLPRQKSPLGNDFPVRGEGTRGTRAALGQLCGHSTGYPWRPRSFRRPEVQRSPCPGEGRGCPQPLRPPSKAAPGTRCRCCYSWPSPARSSALREPAVISSVIKGLGACSTSLKKQDNNNNNGLCSGMLPSRVRIASSAFWLRKLFVLQPRKINGAAHPQLRELSALSPGSTSSCSSAWWIVSGEGSGCVQLQQWGSLLCIEETLLGRRWGPSFSRSPTGAELLSLLTADTERGAERLSWDSSCAWGVTLSGGNAGLFSWRCEQHTRV